MERKRLHFLKRGGVPFAGAMANRQQPVPPIRLYECYWASGGASGTVHVWATDAPTAVRVVREHASCFGLPHEHPLVGKAIPLAIVEEGVERVDRAA